MLQTVQGESCRWRRLDVTVSERRKVVGGNRLNVTDSGMGNGVGGEIRDVTESVKGEEFGVQKIYVSDSARGMGSFGTDVMLQRVQGGNA